MQIDPSVSVVVGLIASAIPTLIAFLLKRSIDALDKTIDGLSKRVDGLGALAIELARLEVRVKHIEDSR